MVFKESEMILLIICQNGEVYQKFLVPEEELEDFDLDGMDASFYFYDDDSTFPEGRNANNLRILVEGDFLKYRDPKMPCTFDRMVLIGYQYYTEKQL
jgi:hypothetical protein